MLGRALRPLAESAGHEVRAPSRLELDLFDPHAIAAALNDISGVVHLATHIPTFDRITERDAWRENDRLRAQSSQLLVDAALALDVSVYVQPSVTFLYPAHRRASEATPLREVPEFLRSVVAAERQASRFANMGRRGVVLRLGLLDGPGTANQHPNPRYGATLHVADAGRALLTAFRIPSGIYNVCRPDERVSNRKFVQATGWGPT